MTVPAEPPVEEVPPPDIHVPDFDNMSLDEKLTYLMHITTLVQQQVGWMVQQVFGMMQAVNGNPMLRRMMGPK